MAAMAALAGIVLAMDAPRADTAIRGFHGTPVSAERIDREATRMMAEAKVQGLAMAVIGDGKVAFVRSWGRRNVERALPLQTDTIMYGASLTKLAFAYMVMQLVDEGKLDLDRSVGEYLAKRSAMPSSRAATTTRPAIRRFASRGVGAACCSCRTTCARRASTSA